MSTTRHRLEKIVWYWENGDDFTRAAVAYVVFRAVVLDDIEEHHWRNLPGDVWLTTRAAIRFYWMQLVC